MKEYVLQLLEELVGAHNYGKKRAKADEIAALVKTAVFPADQVDEPDAEPAKEAKTISLGPVSATVNMGNVLTMPQAPQADSLTSAEEARVIAAFALSAQQAQEAAQQAPGDPTAENPAVVVREGND